MTTLRSPVAGAFALLLIIGAGAPALAQTLGAAPPVPWWRVAAALLLCLVLAALAAWALRARLEAGGSSGRASWTSLAVALRTALPLSRPGPLQLVHSLRASPSLQICLIRFGDEHYLLAATPHSVVLLDRKPAVEEPGR